MDSFFGIGLPELVLILVIAGIVMGPERIGRVARWLGKTTAQLQLISRGFVRQLQDEIDGIDDGEAIKEAMSEVNALRKELEHLRSEFTSVTNKTVEEGKEAFREIEDPVKSIKPPSLVPPRINESNDDIETAVTSNGTNNTDQPPETSELPNLLEVPEDPE